jgi:hypothetical protein
MTGFSSAGSTPLRVQRAPVLAGALGARPDVPHGVVVRLAGVAEGVVAAVRQLPGRLEGLRPAHRAELQRQPLLHGAGEREQAVVGEELAVVRDRALVEERAHHVQGFLDAGEGPGAGPVDAVLGEQAEVSAGQDAFGAAAGEFVEGGERLGDQGRLAQRHGGDARADAGGAAGRRATLRCGNGVRLRRAVVLCLPEDVRPRPPLSRGTCVESFESWVGNF